MRALFPLAIAVVLVGATQAAAQLLPRLPELPVATPGLGAIGTLADDAVRTTTRTLDQARRATIDRLLRDNPDRIALDPDGFPARAREVVVSAPDPALLAATDAHGYAVIARDDVLGVTFARLRVPAGRSLRAAINEIRALGGEVSADQLHLPSGTIAPSPAIAAGPAGGGTAVGVIDGGAAGASVSKGFAAGAPRANDHATAVASLIAGSGGVRGALPGARIVSADVYGTDPAGGNATAIARAIGWLVEQRVSVATISLVGPANPLLGKVIAAAQARGLIVVAAVGNDGPAAPPAYPASYPRVIAVTAVDRRDRALIEAGRATHLDYAAPGADMLAAAANGRAVRVRGTSYAAPLVAGTIARVYPSLAPAAIGGALAQVDAGARDLGPRGPDRLFGRGLVCGDCRTPAK